MKNTSFKIINKVALVILFFASTIANAQSPIIQNFRDILADAPNQFKNFEVDNVGENQEKQYVLYTSKIAELPFSTTRIISKTNTEPSVYFIKYDVKSLDAMMLKLFTNISSQYITEINEMVKTGNYTGNDVQDNNDSITEVYDINGAHVMDYISNTDAHYIYVYGAPKQ